MADPLGIRRVAAELCLERVRELIACCRANMLHLGIGIAFYRVAG
jgi:hypothetical protein